MIIILVVLIALGAVVFVIFGLKKGPIPTTSQKSEEVAVAGKAVTIEGFAFGPATMTVKTGESVTWTNKDLVGHTATADDGSWDTGVIVNGKSASISFAKAGTYTYHCTPHPIMKGKIEVIE